MYQVQLRNKFQESIATELRERGIAFKFSEVTFGYSKLARTAKYTPPFVLDSGLVLQSKGRFVTADRQKHVLIRQQLPDLDVRFLFYDARQRISKQSTTTYADWCNRYGFKFSCRNASKKAGLPLVPVEWTA